MCVSVHLSVSCPELMHDDTTLAERICGSVTYYDCEGNIHIVSKSSIQLSLLATTLVTFG